MNLLLDTQAVIWYLDNNPKLGPQATRQIMEADGVYVSSITILEVTIKSMLGKLNVPADFGVQVETKGFIPLVFNARHAEAVRQFTDLLRHDPFDRMLLAQAYTEQLALLTADTTLLKQHLPYVLDARVAVG